MANNGRDQLNFPSYRGFRKELTLVLMKVTAGNLKKKTKLKTKKLKLV